jgi:hypothetical protein
MPGKGERKPRPYFFLMALVLLLAAALRIVAIRDAPPGPRFDETFDGERPIYFSENFGEEALYAYFQAMSFLALGWSDFALRFPSIVFGVIEVAAVYALGRRAWNRRAGLLAAALCAASFWALLFSRLGVRLIPLTAVVSLGILMLFKMQDASGKRQEVRRRVWPWGIAAGVLLGLSVHTYTAARALLVLLMGVLVYLALFHRTELRRQMGHWILVIVIAALIAAPLVYYLVTQPQAEARVEQVSGPLETLRQGNMVPLIEYTLAALGMFAFRGGTEWLYNLPGRPIFDPFTAAVFLIGIIIALFRWRASRTAFVLIWLGAGLAPVMLSWPPASTSHAILAQPATYLLAGLGLDVILSWIARGRANGHGSLNRVVPVALASVILALNVVLTVRDYFFEWNTSDSIRWEHQATVTAMGRYADAHPDLRDVAFMGNAVDYHAPWMVVGNSLTSHRTDVRWFNPARALVWNPAGPMTFLIPFRDPDPVMFNQIVRDLFFGVTRQTLDERMLDGRAVFTAYVMPDASALHAQALGTGMHPHDFGGRLTLVGYTLKPAEARPGESVRLLTYWRVERVDASPLVMFVHLLGADGKLVTQEDRLDVALETLHVGDEFLQTHRVALAGDAQAGTYRIAFGLYSPVTRGRVQVGGSDRIEISFVVK